MMQPNAEERKDSNDEDDFFGSQDADQVSELQRREREVEALRRPHYTTGVREGASAAHEAHVQHGFDVGFAEGAKAVTKPAFLYVYALLFVGFTVQQEEKEKEN